MKEQQLFQQKVNDIKRYLQKIIDLETCYITDEKEKSIFLILLILNSMLRSDDKNIDNLYKSARNLKKWALENEKHQITMYVAADAIVYLTNDFVKKQNNMMNIISLHVAVGDVKEQYENRIDKSGLIPKNRAHNIEYAVDMHQPYQEIHKVL